MTPKTAAQARHHAKRMSEGARNVTTLLPPNYVVFLDHLRRTSPGGFNFNAFIRASLEQHAKDVGYELVCE